MIGLYIQATQHSNIISLHLFPRFEYSSVPCTATVCLPNSCQLLTTPKFPMLLALYVSTLSFEPNTNRMVFKSPLSHPTGLPYHLLLFNSVADPHGVFLVRDPGSASASMQPSNADPDPGRKNRLVRKKWNTKFTWQKVYFL